MAHTPTYVDVSTRPILRLAGAEALDLLQRISTNDVSKLRFGGVAHSILTTDKGKIKDVISLVRTADTEFLLLGILSDRDALVHWIDRFIIMEKIAVREATAEFFHYHLAWRDAEMIAPPDGETATIELPARSGSAGVAMIMADPAAGTRALHLIGARSLAGSAEEFLKAHSFISGDESSIHAFHAYHGLPIPGRELNEEVNPHEAGILGLVSFNKGCYIGQEVISRLETYKKVQKRLAAFQLNEEPPELPARLTNGSEEIGQLTSAFRSEDGNSWIGLGFVKSGFMDAPTPLSYGGHAGTGVAIVRAV